MYLVIINFYSYDLGKKLIKQCQEHQDGRTSPLAFQVSLIILLLSNHQLLRSLSLEELLKLTLLELVAVTVPLLIIIDSSPNKWHLLFLVVYLATHLYVLHPLIHLLAIIEVPQVPQFHQLKLATIDGMLSAFIFSSKLSCLLKKSSGPKYVLMPSGHHLTSLPVYQCLEWMKYPLQWIPLCQRNRLVMIRCSTYQQHNTISFQSWAMYRNLHVTVNFAFRKLSDLWAPYQIPPVTPPQAVALLTVRLMNHRAPASPILLMVSFGMTSVSFSRMLLFINLVYLQCYRSW